MESEAKRLAPRDNPSLVGQEAAEETLLRAYQAGRLPHAWLLTGAKGIGKATLAYRFARFLFKGPQEGGLFSDGPTSLVIEAEDPVFLRIAAGGHSDFRVLERQTDDKGRLRGVITVDEVRKSLGFLRMTPAEAGWRVLLVDAADDLNPNAANALLKLLEEPPEQALLLLVSHAPARLLPTIRSRCCQLALAPLAPEALLELLGQHLPELDAQELGRLAEISEGSLGRALDLADCGGLDLLGDILVLLEGLPQIDVPALQGLAERLGRGSDDTAFRTSMTLLGWWLARFLRAAETGEQPSEIHSGEAALMARLADLHPMEDWIEAWQSLSHLTLRARAVNLDRKHVTISAFQMLESPRGLAPIS